jgi:hypothetical protein
MVTWGDLVDQRPDLAAAGHGLLYQFGVGLGMLATVRPDGAPRVHPMCPIVHGRGLYAFIVPSPKQRDLRRDGRYALHCFPPADDEDALAITGRAVVVDDAELRRALVGQFVQERAHVVEAVVHDDDLLVELLLEGVLLTRTTGHGDWDPQHTVWHA